MNEPLSDDSSAASSGDEMLNMRVSFLSQESDKGRGKGSDREESEDGAQAQAPAKLPGNKRKREGATDSVSGDETEKRNKVRVREKARRAFKEEFSQKIGAPDKLFWHETSEKGKKMIHPVRVVLREEVVGIALKEWNDETHSPIHFLQYPRGGKGQYDIASHRSLSPYHGKGEKDRWCPVKVKQYSKQLKKKIRLNATDLKIEEAFLLCALQKSLAEGEQAERLKSVDEAVPEEISADAEAAADSESSEEEEETGGTRRTPRRHTGAHERKETLRPGDHIEYYAQQSTGGDERGRCTAEILYIDPKGNRGQPLLTIDDPLTTLQPDHHVRRVKRKRYGRLLDNAGVFRAIEEYILKREGDPDAHAKMMARNNAATKDFVRRRKEETLANMEKDGFNSSLAKDALRM